MTVINIHVPDGCCAEPDPIRLMLEKIMSSLDELNERVTAQGAMLAAQADTISALRVYVTGIETAVRDLSSGEVLSATVQEKVNAIVAAMDANTALVEGNQAGLAAAGDGDIET